MCFKRKEKLVLPHPQEYPDYNKTIENTDIEDIRTLFYQDWQVKDWDFGDSVEIIISNQYSVPACTYMNERQIYVRPEWYNTGVLAHEIAHVVWYLLTQEEKDAFKVKFDEELLKDKLMIFLHENNPYMDTSTIEAHAEIYRYLGLKMPETLKKYYPYLM